MAVELMDESHLDHGVSKEQMDYVLKQLGDTNGLTIRTISLPGSLGTVPLALYGPAVGDKPVPESEVHYGHRGGNRGVSRLVDWPMRKTGKVTVVVGPYGDKPAVLYTIYGGPNAPQELSDPNLSESKRGEAEEFWKAHALSSQG